MTRVFIWLAAVTVVVAVVIISVAYSFLPQDYPVQITVAFDYNGRHYDRTFLTVMRQGYLDGEIYGYGRRRWDPVRDKISIPLPDGSLLVVRPEWPTHMAQLPSGYIYRNPARWAWLNNTSSPTQIVAGDGSLRLSSDRFEPPPFAWFSVSAAVERVSMIVLANARAADQHPDDADRILGSFRLGRGNAFTGSPDFPAATVFLGVWSRWETDANATRLRSAPGWINLAGCRVLIRTHGNPGPTLDGDMSNWNKGRFLIRDGDAWIADRGPHPTEAEVIYPGVVSSAGPILGASILQSIHDLGFDGGRCLGIDIPVESTGAYFDFGDAGILSVAQSTSWMIIRN
jgi:hypothetical protein